MPPEDDMDIFEDEEIFEANDDYMEEADDQPFGDIWEDLELPEIRGTKDEILAATAPAIKRQASAATWDWWGAHKKQRGKDADLWGDEDDDEGHPVARRGAGALGKWLGGHARHTSPELAIELRDALRFARTMCGMTGRKKVKAVDWSSEGGAGSANLETRQVNLDPGPVRKILTKELTADQAHTTLGGVALHEGAHLSNTPKDQMRRYAALRPDMRIGLTYGALVEDAFVEAKILAEYPGYRDYLDEAWAFTSPDKEVVLQLRSATPAWGKTGATFIAQEFSRRYRTLTAEQRDLLAQLPEEQQRFLAAAGRITDKAHDHKLKPDQRVALAEALIKLFEDGEKGEDDQPDTDPPPGDLGDTAQAMMDAGRAPQREDGTTDGTTARGLDYAEANEAEAEEVRERRLDQHMIPGGYGAAPTTVTWTTEPLTPHYKRTAKDRLALALPHVPALAKALALRANKPHRQRAAQLAGRLDGHRLVNALLPDTRPRVYRRTEILAAPAFGLTVLQDESGSMTGGPADLCASAGLMLIHAVAQANAAGGDIAIKVRGCTTTEHQHKQLAWIRRIYDERTPDPQRLGLLTDHDNNRDGEALHAVVLEAERSWPDRQRLLLYLNDGEPYGRGYGGDPAYQQVRAVVERARRKGTAVVTLFLGAVQGYQSAALATMYGPQGRGWYHVPDVADMPAVVAKIVQQQLAWRA